MRRRGAPGDEIEGYRAASRNYVFANTPAAAARAARRAARSGEEAPAFVGLPYYAPRRVRHGPAVHPPGLGPDVPEGPPPGLEPPPEGKDEKKADRKERKWEGKDEKKERKREVDEVKRKQAEEQLKKDRERLIREREAHIKKAKALALARRRKAKKDRENARKMAFKKRRSPNWTRQPNFRVPFLRDVLNESYSYNYFITVFDDQPRRIGYVLNTFFREIVEDMIHAHAEVGDPNTMVTQPERHVFGITFFATEGWGGAHDRLVNTPSRHFTMAEMLFDTHGAEIPPHPIMAAMKDDAEESGSGLDGQLVTAITIRTHLQPEDVYMASRHKGRTRREEEKFAKQAAAEAKAMYEARARVAATFAARKARDARRKERRDQGLPADEKDEQSAVDDAKAEEKKEAKSLGERIREGPAAERQLMSIVDALRDRRQLGILIEQIEGQIAGAASLVKERLRRLLAYMYDRDRTLQGLGSGSRGYYGSGGSWHPQLLLQANPGLTEEWYKAKRKNRSIVQIKNHSDNFCLLWAVALQLQIWSKKEAGRNFDVGTWERMQAKQWSTFKTAVYDLYREIYGEEPHPNRFRQLSFPEDVIRVANHVGYPIAVLGLSPNGKTSILFDSHASAPLPQARLDKEKKKRRKQAELAFAQAIMDDSKDPDDVFAAVGPWLEEKKEVGPVAVPLQNSRHIMVLYTGAPAFHYDLVLTGKIGEISAMRGGANRRLCSYCLDTYISNGGVHRCNGSKCIACVRFNCPTTLLSPEQFKAAIPEKCQDCKFLFYTPQCLANHRLKQTKRHKYTPCEATHFCEQCRVPFKTRVRVTQPGQPVKFVSQTEEDGGHRHNSSLCGQCRDLLTRDHVCYMSKVELKKPSREVVTWDSESIQPGGIHSTVVVVHCLHLGVSPTIEAKAFKRAKAKAEAESKVPINYTIDDYTPNKGAGPREEGVDYFVSVSDPDGLRADQKFVRAMIKHRQHRLDEMNTDNLDEEGKKYPRGHPGYERPRPGFTALAWNGSGYDIPVMMKAFVNNGSTNEFRVTYQGTKVLRGKLGNGDHCIQFVDVNRFIPGPLSRTVETFNMAPELKALGCPLRKGCAPGLDIDIDYLGPFPGRKTFFEKVRREKWFDDWYDEMKAKYPGEEKGGLNYNYLDHLIDYCIQDVRLARMAAAAFRYEFMQATGSVCDPYNYPTITAACFQYYLNAIMPRETPFANTPIRHNSVFRQAFFGGRVEAIRSYFPTPDLPEGFEAPDSSFRPSGPNAYFVHSDFTSLYPSVLVSSRQPWDHPEWFEKSHHPTIRSFGLTKDNVNAVQGDPLRTVATALDKFLAPNTLAVLWIDYHVPDEANVIHPVFPRKMKGTGNQYDLEPGDCVPVSSVELTEALKVGYVVDQVHGAFFWEQKRTSTNQFTEYILHFMKLKDTYGDWPKDCKTDEQKQAYLDAYQAHVLNCGVQLVWDEICDNPGGKETIKLILNSLWGRFAMKDNHGNSRIFDFSKPKDKRDFMEIFYGTSGEYHVAGSPVALHEDGDPPRVLLHFTQPHIEFKNPKNKGSPTNVPVGIFTTAHARVVLYKSLCQVGRRVAYYDTDSIIYEVDPDRADEKVPDGEIGWAETMPEGGFLGQLKREGAPGAKIWRFAAAGKKSYVYFYTKTDKDKTEYYRRVIAGEEQPLCICALDKRSCKAFMHSKVVTKGLPTPPNAFFVYELIRVSLLREWKGLPAPSPYTCKFTQIIRKPADVQVKTNEAVRKLRFFNTTITKFPDGSTLPHGHKDIEVRKALWESSEELLTAMLMDAESDLELACMEIEGYEFDYSAEPPWVNDEKHPEHEKRIEAYREREQKRAEERERKEAEMARELEELLEREQKREEAEELHREEQKGVEDAWAEANAADEPILGAWDDREEEELDVDDNEEVYEAAGKAQESVDEEMEGNEFVGDMAGGPDDEDLF